jgi:Resolvase, N terminal domain
MLDYARPGDTVVVTAIDRLGRSVVKITSTIADLDEGRITLRALREGVDTGTPTGPAAAAIMGTLAELELELGPRPPRRISPIPSRPKPAGHQATKAQPIAAEQLGRLAATGEPEPVRELCASNWGAHV